MTSRHASATTSAGSATPTTRAASPIGAAHHTFDVGVVGGPTVVIDYGRTRFVTDPTFDDPRDYGATAKLTPPSVPAAVTGPRAADVAAALAVPRVVIAHIAGWSIYSETIADVRTAFDEAGIADRLAPGDAGSWSLLDGPAR